MCLQLIHICGLNQTLVSCVSFLWLVSILSYCSPTRRCNQLTFLLLFRVLRQSFLIEFFSLRLQELFDYKVFAFWNASFFFFAWLLIIDTKTQWNSCWFIFSQSVSSILYSIFCYSSDYQISWNFPKDQIAFSSTKMHL